MAKKQPQKTKKYAQAQPRRKRRFALGMFLLAMLAVGGLFGYMYVQSQLVHLKQATLYLEDLPPAMEGTTLLFVSDVNIKSKAEAAQTKRLFNKLEKLQPDLLLLGGDYSASTLLQTLNSEEAAASGTAEAYALDFIRSLSGFNAPMGKYAVLGEADAGPALSTAFDQAGVQLLADACATVEKSGAQLVIAGLNDSSSGLTPYSTLGSYFSGDECVIALTHNPAGYIGIRVNEARGGGAWADVVLSGHTLGGQIRAFGRSIRTMTDEEARCIAGWYYTDGLPMLVSQGLGCRDVDLRFGTQSEVWLITLRKPQMAKLPDF